MISDLLVNAWIDMEIKNLCERVAHSMACMHERDSMFRSHRRVLCQPD